MAKRSANEAPTIRSRMNVTHCVCKVCATGPHESTPNCTNLAPASNASRKKCWGARTCKSAASHSKNAARKCKASGVLTDCIFRSFMERKVEAQTREQNKHLPSGLALCLPHSRQLHSRAPETSSSPLISARTVELRADIDHTELPLAKFRITESNQNVKVGAVRGS